MFTKFTAFCVSVSCRYVFSYMIHEAAVSNLYRKIICGFNFLYHLYLMLPGHLKHDENVKFNLQEFIVSIHHVPLSSSFSIFQLHKSYCNWLVGSWQYIPMMNMNDICLTMIDVLITCCHNWWEFPTTKQAWWHTTANKICLTKTEEKEKLAEMIGIINCNLQYQMKLGNVNHVLGVTINSIIVDWIGT